MLLGQQYLHDSRSQGSKHIPFLVSHCSSMNVPLLPSPFMALAPKWLSSPRTFGPIGPCPSRAILDHFWAPYRPTRNLATRGYIHVIDRPRGFILCRRTFPLIPHQFWGISKKSIFWPPNGCVHPGPFGPSGTPIPAYTQFGSRGVYPCDRPS